MSLSLERKIAKLEKELKKANTRIDQLENRDQNTLIQVLQTAMAEYLDNNVSFDINDIKESESWPDDKRIDVIGSNGDNDGVPHYLIEQAI